MEYTAKTDFIPRALQGLEQYENMLTQRYEVTMLLSCALGILVCILDQKKSEIPQEEISDRWGINAAAITKCKATEKPYDDRKYVIDVVTHLRNSLGHAHFEPQGQPINKVSFKDYYDDKGREQKIQNFEAIIPVSELREFISKLCSHLRLLPQN